jgi:hypothetical protein
VAVGPESRDTAVRVHQNASVDNTSDMTSATPAAPSARGEAGCGAGVGRACRAAQPLLRHGPYHLRPGALLRHVDARFEGKPTIGCRAILAAAGEPSDGEGGDMVSLQHRSRSGTVVGRRGV